MHVQASAARAAQQKLVTRSLDDAAADVLSGRFASAQAGLAIALRAVRDEKHAFTPFSSTPATP